MKELQEKLSTYIDRIERFEEQSGKKKIILSRKLDKELLLDGDEEDIEKEPILWRLNDYNMFYIVTVPPGKHVKKHKHDEDIFRFLAQGELTINKKHKVKAGEWFVIKGGTEYEITTKKGYVTLAAYTSICQTSRVMTGTYLVKSKKAKK
jgi:hypothetical protein